VGNVEVVGKVRWLTLGEAAQLLGVDATTLRGWADTGKIRVFRTPGGHRRFDPSDLESLIQPPPPPRGRLGAVPGSPAAREWLTSRTWYARIDEASRVRVRAYCAELMQTLVSHLTDETAGPGRLDRARQLGATLGREVAGWGLTPSQSTEVFLHFKRHVTDALAAPPLGAAGQVRSMRDADTFLGEVLQAMITSYEEGASD